MKRFYKDVSVAEEGSAWRVLLDGRAIKSKAGHALEVPTRALAEAIAEEWRAQGETVAPQDMHLTRLAFAVLDGVRAERHRVAEHALSYGRTDLVSYRAEQPQELIERQARAWDPLLDWSAERFGAHLSVAHGITHVAQSEDAVAALERAIAAHEDFALAALHSAATITGSLILALALSEQRLDAEQAFAAATVDEAYQAEKWGRDAEAEARLKRLAAELSAAERFLKLLA